MVLRDLASRAATDAGFLKQARRDLEGTLAGFGYELTLEVQTALGQSATAGHTDVLTMVTATGRPMATSGEPVRCVSTGALEKRIAETEEFYGALQHGIADPDVELPAEAF